MRAMKVTVPMKISDGMTKTVDGMRPLKKRNIAGIATAYMMLLRDVGKSAWVKAANRFCLAAPASRLSAKP